MLSLKPKSLKLFRPRLISLLPSHCFFTLERMYFLGGDFLERFGDVVVLVEVLGRLVRTKSRI